MASKKLSELDSNENFNTIKTNMQKFNTVLQNRRYNDDSLSVVPYFLYVITQNEKGELISMALGDDTSKYNDADPIQPVVITSPSPDNKSIADVINTHISEKLQQLYDTTSVEHIDLYSSTSGPINPSSSDENSYVDSSSLRLSDSFSRTPVSKDVDTSGGSRSRKHRRRHNQKKNKNTKRRNRK